MDTDNSIGLALKVRSMHTKEVSNALFIPMIRSEACMGSLEVYRKSDSSNGYEFGGFTSEEQTRLKNVS